MATQATPVSYILPTWIFKKEAQNKEYKTPRELWV